MMKYLFLFGLIYCFSCEGPSRKNYATIKKGNVVMKGDIVNDTMFNDTIKYYDLAGNLTGVKFFKDGKEDGSSIDFYTSGKPMIVTSFSNGVKNGYNSYYDTLGNCFYKDFYYYDLTVGPIIYYNKKGSPKRYFFSSLQNETLFRVDYESWNGINNIISDCINFTINSIRKDTVKEKDLFLYLMAPPKFIFKYSIYKYKRSTDSDYIEVKQIDNSLPFIRITLPDLSSEESYAVGLNVYDSILNKRTIIYKDF